MVVGKSTASGGYLCVISSTMTADIEDSSFVFPYWVWTRKNLTTILAVNTNTLLILFPEFCMIFLL